MIEVVEVTHHYGVRPVLRNVSLSIADGEVVALMGPNGMGKSTLLGVMAGVIAPLKGYVAIAGLRRRSTSEVELDIRRKVVYLAADPWLPSGTTGREWVLACGRVWNVDDDRLIDHADRLLSLFNLDEMADSPISSYSTGQKKKVALCGAIVTDAKIMLLDEPFAGGLDPSGILALKRLITWHVARRDRTIVIATPVPELVEELASRVAIIRDGRIAAFDSISGLRAATGSSGALDVIYESIASPDTALKIDRYFEESG